MSKPPQESYTKRPDESSERKPEVPHSSLRHKIGGKIAKVTVAIFEIFGVSGYTLPIPEASATTEDMQHHDIEKLREELWTKQQAAYEKAARLAKEPQEKIFTAKELEAAFSRNVKCYMGCMDEGDEREGMNKIGTGGSCILMSPEQKNLLVQKLHAKGIDVEFAHEHKLCGARAEACKEMTDEEVKTFTSDHTKNMNQRLGKGEKEEILTAEEMSRPADLHPAREIVVDCHGFCQPKKLGLTAFKLTAAVYPDMPQLAKELEFAVGRIAESAHGMGAERFKKEPLLLILIEDPSDPALTAKVAQVVDKVQKLHPKTTKIVHLIAPK